MAASLPTFVISMYKFFVNTVYLQCQSENCIKAYYIQHSTVSRRHFDMNLATPQEEKEILLPKTCYFSDNKSKVDYVIVLPNIQENVRENSSRIQIDKFMAQIKDKGLLVEESIGQFHSTLIFLKIHAPHKVLLKYANIYNTVLISQNPYYKYQETILLKCRTTPLTRPDPSSSIYNRAEKVLSGRRPTEITSVERAQIVQEILNHISFTFEDDEITLKTLLDKQIFLQGYAIHDGDCTWTKEGPLTDRQYWSPLKYLFAEQPVHLIRRYYGSQLGFYFALMSLYTKMLIVPAIVGTITIIAGYSTLFSENHIIEEEVCKSDVLLCSDQKLKTACNLMKLAYIIDNPLTIVYVILCSFWGAIFWNLWQRRQAMLRLRWNLCSTKTDRTMRKEFQDSAKTRKSSITGETEYYIPPSKKILSTIFSYFIMLLMLVIFFLVVFMVIEYRFMLRRSLNYDEVDDANELELLSSSIITAAIIVILNGCVDYILNFYEKIIRFLTMIRMPRTKLQYNRMYLQLMFIIVFANHFSPLFYLAYVKGFFHRYPGDFSDKAIIGTLQSDLCKPAGCLVDLGMQLLVIMVFKSMMRFGLDYLTQLASFWHKYAIPKDSTKEYGQWEKDFAMKELDQSVINENYTELILQYSFITFFNASLPIIGLLALVHNMLKIHHDAYRFLTLHRRPILDQIPDVGGWNDVLKVVTVLGCISNTFVVTFRTSFIQRYLYQKEHNGSYKGYINSTLSKFATAEFQEKSGLVHNVDETYCYYTGHRYPPEHERKYERTEESWKHFAIRAVYFIILEKLTLLLSIALNYIIPEIPRKVKVKLEYDQRLLKEAREAQLEAKKGFDVQN